MGVAKQAHTDYLHHLAKTARRWKPRIVVNAVHRMLARFEEGRKRLAQANQLPERSRLFNMDEIAGPLAVAWLLRHCGKCALQARSRRAE